MPRRHQDDSLADVFADILLNLATRHAGIGLGICFILFVVGLVFHMHPKAGFGLGELTAYIFYFLAVAGVVITLTSWLFRRLHGHEESASTTSTGAPTLPDLHKVPSLLSQGEKAFYDVLYQVVGNRAVIFTKVRLLDLIQCEESRGWRIFTNRINRKHVDFVLCDPQTLAPLLVIELDDRSHHSSQATTSDQVKNEVLAKANIPMHRQTCQTAYDVNALAATLQQWIG